MTKQQIHNARTGQIIEVEITESDMWRDRLSLPANATETEINAARQQLQDQIQADIQRREQMQDYTPGKLMQRIEALESEIARLNQG